MRYSALRRHALLALLTGTALGASALSAPPVVAAAAAPALAPVSAQVARDLSTRPLGTLYGVFATVRGGTAASRAALMVDHGLTVARDYPSVGVVYGSGTLADVTTLRRDPNVTYLSTSDALRALDDSSGWATRVEQVQRATGNGPYRDAAGHVLDGSGIGVAVVDSGVDGTHPDLASRVVRNTKYTCTSFPLNGTCLGVVVSEQLPNTDPSSGHGSHVAGIVAGDGTASHGTFHGVAPKASLYGFSVGDGDNIWTSEVAAAYQDILDGNAAGTNTPPIRVVTNSWGNGAGSAYNPNDVVSLLIQRLVASGVTVLFAAGNGDTTNNGGTGADDRLSSTAKDPTPGVITVANYDDAGTGTRNGDLDSSSSRGKQGVPVNYPDLSAPGASITSTCTPAQAICATGAGFEWEPYYQVLSGTSMATPHVAGLVALLLQARSTLTPSEVESLLQDTAYKFGVAGSYEADPQNPGGTTSFDKGAGLADVQAALDALGISHDGGESAQGTPQVAITSPADGTTSNGTAPLSVTGTAEDGYVAPKPFVSQVLASGDGGDLSAPSFGANDLTGLSVVETPTGLRYTVGLRDLTDVNTAVGTTVVTRATINGVVYSTEVSWDGTTATAGTDTNSLNTAPPVAVTADLPGNTISFSVTWGELGNPAAMTPAIKVSALSYVGYPVDYAPGGQAAVGPLNLQPEYGAFLIRRPSLAPAPTTSVTLAVDGGAPAAVATTGSTPSYGWSATVPTTGLADGQHSLTATVLTDGVARATRTLAFSVLRPVVVVSSAAVTSPTEGAVLDRSLTTVTGTTTTNAPAAQVRRVTVQVTGTGYDSGELLADGTDSWSLPLDAGALVGGTYVLTARLSLDGTVVATATRTVTVPTAPVLVSCNPKGLSFWQAQYNGSRKAVFTTAEANALADKAVTLSSGYFGNRSALVNVLYASGKLPPETAAARQYAPLLLNLAGGQLSASMSAHYGLSGKEVLSPSVYDTAKVGTTVKAATAWVRSHLSGSEAASAEQTAVSINTRSGLSC